MKIIGAFVDMLMKLDPKLDPDHCIMWKGTKSNLCGGTNRNIWNVGCIITMVPEVQ